MKREEIIKLEDIAMCLATFSRCYHIFFALHRSLTELDHSKDGLHSFRTICNALLSDMTLNWCKVFGVNAEQTHWKGVVPHHEDFRRHLFDEIDEKEFSEHWREIINFRNNIVAHWNLQDLNTGETPSFEIARQSSVITHNYLRSLPPEEIAYNGPNCIDQYGKQAALVVLNKLNLLQ